MIFLDESSVTGEAASIEHQKLANAMMEMAATTGWKLIESKLRSEMASAYAAMLDAKTGDQSLKACTAYTVLKTIVEAPEVSVKNSLARIAALAEEESNMDPVQVHHRAGPGMTEPRKKPSVPK